MRIIKYALTALALSVSGLSLASTPLYLSKCTSDATCSDSALKSQAIIVSGAAKADVVIYDTSQNKAYHYTVVTGSGLEFPDMVMVGARKVGELDAATTQAVADYVEITANPILTTLDKQFGPRNSMVGYYAYGLVRFDVDFKRSDITSGLTKLRYRVNQLIADQTIELKSSFFEAVMHSLSLSLDVGKNGISVAWPLDMRPANFILTSDSDGASWGIIAESKVNGGGQIETNFTAIVLMDDNGNVVFEIPVENNRVDLGQLIGQTFNIVNPGSLKTWFQGMNLDLSWEPGCSNCVTTITDINDPDVGEVEPE